MASPLNLEKRKGTFLCAGCSLPLFKSSAKFESGELIAALDVVQQSCTGTVDG